MLLPPCLIVPMTHGENNMHSCPVYIVLNPSVLAPQDTQWSETGDRYLLKLFRDFVFHQTDEEGAPLSDWGHVVEALNKVASAPRSLVSHNVQACTSCMHVSGH